MEAEIRNLLSVPSSAVSLVSVFSCSLLGSLALFSPCPLMEWGLTLISLD